MEDTLFIISSAEGGKPRARAGGGLGTSAQEVIRAVLAARWRGRDSVAGVRRSQRLT